MRNRKRRAEERIKRSFDIAASFLGIVLFLPVWILIGALVKVTSPGPVFFLQDRPGYHRKIFKVYKFRTMRPGSDRMVKGVEVMKDDDRVTGFGKFLRRSKLDEIPQLINVLRGEMSLVGPRPERIASLEDYTPFIEKRLDMRPGLTGLAQVSGNIYLDLRERYRLDVYYVEHFSLWLDVRIFFRTVGVVLFGEDKFKGKPLVKRGLKQNINADDAETDDYGYKKQFKIDKGAVRKVLITGAGSYIGESFASYAARNYPNLIVDTVDMIGGNWREKRFEGYDSVFHVAGIAHADVDKADEETKARYYSVNTDLAVETARKAKKEGVKQFIFMSSIIIYGESAPFGKRKVIDEKTVPAPANFYGDSKWQADKKIRELGNADFHAAILRPPMIYGKGSKGNYPILEKMAKRLPVFPDVKNSRSMLYIDNLCEFLCQLILSGKDGIYFPQNQEYVQTSQMVRMIASESGHPIWVTSLLNPFVLLASHIPGKVSKLTNKAFGNMIYSRKLSVYPGLDYEKCGLGESIEAVEKEDMGI